MEEERTNLILRSDTILGVCQGAGEDLGISPLWLRVPFAVSLLLAPLAVVGAYFALGALVLATRLLYPTRRRGAAAASVAAAQPAAPAEPQEALPLAA